MKEITNAALKAVHDLMPGISMLFGGDECLALTDTENFIHCVMGNKYNMPCKIGDPLNPAISTVFQSKTASVFTIPEHIVPGNVKCYVLPIFDVDDSGDVVGLLCVTNHLANRRKLCELTDDLVRTVDKISTTVKSVFSEIHGLTSMSENLLDKTNKTVQRVGDTDRVVNIVKDISKQTNLLGLNAAIESARAGEAGKGFSIVASEIRSLARTSKDSIDEISEISKCISNDSIEINSIIQDVNAAFNRHLNDLQSVVDLLGQLESTFEQLNLLSDKN